MAAALVRCSAGQLGACLVTAPRSSTGPPARSGPRSERPRRPVGLTTALAVAQHGVPVVLIEADDSVCVGSRAICISRRSLEILERVGAADEFLRVGLPWTGGRSFYRDQEVLHFKMPQDENQKLPPMINLAQYQMEQILLDRAGQMPELIEVRWQTKVTAVRPCDDLVRLTLSTNDPSGRQLVVTVAPTGGGNALRVSAAPTSTAGAPPC